MTEAVVVGADLGSSAVRVLAVDAAGAIVAQAGAAYPGAAGWEPGFADPRAWLDALAAALATLVGSLPPRTRVTAFAAGGLTPAVAPLAGGRAVTYRHPAGQDEPAGDPRAAQVELLRAADPAVVAAQPWDLVGHRLGAPRVQSQWPGDPALDALGPLVPTGTVVGHASGAHGLPAGTTIAAGGGDAYLACWAAGIDTVGCGLDPGGRTGGLAVGAPAGTRVPRTYAVPSARPGVDVVGAPVSGHGLLLDWLARITRVAVPELVGLAATVPPGANGLSVLPYLDGERAPRWRPDLRGVVAGIGDTTTVADLARAVLEAAAFGLRHLADTLAAGGVPLTRLVCGGSPGQSRPWSAVKATVLGVPAAIPTTPHLSAYGAALAAGAALGWWPAPTSRPRASWPGPPVEHVGPDASPPVVDLYAARYQAFLDRGDHEVALLRRGTRPGTTLVTDGG